VINLDAQLSMTIANVDMACPCADRASAIFQATFHSGCLDIVLSHELCTLVTPESTLSKVFEALHHRPQLVQITLISYC